MTTSLNYDEAESIALFDHVESQAVTHHRWYTKRLIVFRRGADLFGFFYLEPATEEQEGQDIFESDPVPVFPVVAREVTTTVYEVA